MLAGVQSMSIWKLMVLRMRKTLAVVLEDRSEQHLCMQEYHGGSKGNMDDDYAYHHPPRLQALSLRF